MYTDQEVEYLLENYPERDIELLAEQLGKTRRSVIGKLSRLGVYQKKVYLTKRGEPPVTKAELVHRISEKLEIPLEKLEGLDKAPKEVLRLLSE